MADWEKNTCSDYRKRYFRRPVTEQAEEGFEQKWIVYGNEYVGGKELTVEPGKTVLVKDTCAYGCVVIQGHGKFGSYDCETPTLIRFGQATADEFFVSKDKAQKGVTITNTSKYEPLVMLKHFGPDGHILQMSEK